MDKYFSSLDLYKQIVLHNLDDNVTGSTKAVMQSRFVHDDVPGLLIVSKSHFLGIEVAKRHLKAVLTASGCHIEGRKRVIETEITYHNNKYEIRYEQYHDHIEIDLALFNCTSNDRSIVCSFLKELLLRQNIVGQKHRILLHGVDTLNNNAIVSLRNIIEDSFEHAYFVLTCTRMTPALQSSIITRLFYVNVSRDFDMLKMIKVLIATHPTHQKSETILNLALNLQKVSKNDILNSCILLHLYPHFFHERSTIIGHLNMTIDDTLSKCMKYIVERPSKNKADNNKELSLLGKEIRLICTKIGAACASLVDVAQCVIKFVAINYPHAIHDVAQLSADMQHTAIQSNKELFVLELYFHQVLMKMGEIV